ncbi:hypothetical protein [Coralloluteibacterium stylophorae]|uniref:Uncharacterized protein n=1 Tax=Coralloluteibacterium stylophorae TaxID=1776034 RepID=A0A8J8AYR9_9GAMM|nr:hypothetical protein [Coralloluteibacterium stylophorae]MBS7456520.1 hypothetical protein [Coralloluteibacterium stylophorae]
MSAPRLQVYRSGSLIVGSRSVSGTRRLLLLVVLLLAVAPLAAQVPRPYPPPPGTATVPGRGVMPSPLQRHETFLRDAEVERQRAQVERLRQQRRLDALDARSARRSLDLRQATTRDPLVAERMQRQVDAAEAERRLQRARRAQALQGEIEAARPAAADLDYRARLAPRQRAIEEP